LEKRCHALVFTWDIIGNQPAIKIVPEQPTTNIAKPMGTLTANKEKRIGKAIMPR
jgi:hypothetical protein